MISRLISFGTKKPVKVAATEPVSEPRQQLLVDISVITAHDAKTGIQRVVRALWLMLQNLSNDRLVVRPVFATPRRGYCYSTDYFLNSGGLEPNDLHYVSAKAGDIFLGLDLSAHLLPRHVKQIEGWQQNGAKIHLLVYDLLPFTNPEWFNAKLTKNFCLWLEFLARRADSAICISGHVAVELKKYLLYTNSQRSKKIDIHQIQLGFDIAATVPTKGSSSADQALLELTKTQPTILMVGTIEPRKAYDKALDAFEWLWREHPSTAPNLIIVGKPGWKTSQLQKRMKNHIQCGRKFVWLDDVSDELLEELYASSAGFLATSRAEGFGLPIVESLAHGLPVLARDISVFKEIVCDGISFFSDDTAPALGLKLMNLTEAKTSERCRVELAQLTTWFQSMNSLIGILGIERDFAGEVIGNGAQRP
jgi:glycosyltransferase involved in cell wall biosynthesis